jgi:hypothetical protein
LKIIVIIFLAAIAASAHAADPSSACLYPIHIDLIQGAPNAKGMHADSCINDEAKWVIVDQDSGNVLFAKIQSSTGMPRLAIAMTDASLSHFDFACEHMIERDKELSCDSKEPTRTVKFKIKSKR